MERVSRCAKESPCVQIIFNCRGRTGAEIGKIAGDVGVLYKRSEIQLQRTFVFFFMIPFNHTSFYTIVKYREGAPEYLLILLLSEERRVRSSKIVETVVCVASASHTFQFYGYGHVIKLWQISGTCSKKASKNVCTSAIVVSHDSLSPTPSTSSAIRTPENTEEDADDHEPTDEGDIQIE